MNNFKENKPSLNRLVKKSATKEKILLLFPLVAVATTAIMLILATSITSANTVFGQTNSTDQQQQQSTSSNTSDKSGIITSVQTDAQGKWNLNGTWSLKGTNSGSPTFTSEFSMAKLDGSAKHKHNTSDFKIVRQSA